MAASTIPNKSADGEMRQQPLPLAFIRGEVVIEKPKDLFIPPDALEVVLESFEGPLDLLLYLIKKQKFDILDLPLAPITTQYMTYIDLMKDAKLELAAEYLVMAAVLTQIKSKLLLPKPEVIDDDDDPRAELVRKLQEYEVIKRAATSLDELPRLERDIHLATVSFPQKFSPTVNQANVELSDLVSALNAVLKRCKAFEHHHIAKESLSTRERMSLIIDKLTERSEITFINFVEFFTPEEGRHGVVVTFLAILELIKENLIECIQVTSSGGINVRLKRSVDAIN